MGDLLMLMDDQQLQKLAVLLRNQEQMLSLSINSEPDRVKFLKECNDAYNIVVTLLEDSIDLRNKHEGAGAKKADIAKDTQEYVKYGINLGMQCIQNCGMRVAVFEKIKTNFDDLATELNKTESTDMNNDFESLAKEVLYYKNSMWEYVTNLRSAQSKAYSDVLKLQGIEFPTFVNRYKNILGYKDEFELLEDQKLEVYNSIIEESGRTKMPVVYRKTKPVNKKVGGILRAITGNGRKVPPNLDGLKFYSATMPNGMDLAYEISHT